MPCTGLGALAGEVWLLDSFVWIKLCWVTTHSVPGGSYRAWNVGKAQPDQPAPTACCIGMLCREGYFTQQAMLPPR